MKHTVKRLMALLLAILLALPAFAEESEDGIVALGDDSPADMIEVSDGVPDLAIEPMVGEAGGAPAARSDRCALCGSAHGGCAPACPGGCGHLLLHRG